MATMNSGLGGAADYGENSFKGTAKTLGDDDDGSISVDITSAFSGGINFFGTTYTEIFINSNGSISFGGGSTSASTTGGLDALNLPAIVPFWADIDITKGGDIHWDIDPANGKVTITWDSVAPFSGTGTNSFQVVLTDTGGGDFETEIIYGDIQWSDGSSDAARNGVAGITDGDTYHAEFDGSGNTSELLNYETNNFGGGDANGTFVVPFAGGFPEGFGVGGSSSDDVMGLGFIDLGGEEITIGDDFVDGGAGNDSIDGDQGNDTILGGAGNDTILSGSNGGGGGGGPAWTELGNGQNATGTSGQDYFRFTGGANSNGVVRFNNGPGTDDGDGVADYLHVQSTGDGITLIVQDFEVFTDKIVLSDDFTVSSSSLSNGTANITVTLNNGNQQFFSIDYVGGTFSSNQIFTTTLPGAPVVSDDDLLDGGDDADTFEMADNFGADTIVGGEGGNDSDTIDASNLTGDLVVNLLGDEAGTLTDGSDTLEFSQVENIFAGSGNDVLDASADSSGLGLFGGAGLDTITGGIGEDYIDGGVGEDLVDGGAGNDSIFGGAGSDSIDAGAGDDWVTDADGLFDSDGGDTVNLGTGNDVFVGSGRGANDSDLVYGGAGNDTITVQQSFDTVYGGDGDDVITSTDEVAGFGDLLDGGAGNDTITGANTNDTIIGGTGNDSLSGLGNTDSIDGGSGNDTIDGGSGNDTIDGGDGNDSLVGGDGWDRLRGGDGADTITGGAGRDFLYGGTGDDSLVGGGANGIGDYYYLESGYGNDTIIDADDMGRIDTRTENVTSDLTVNFGANLDGTLLGVDGIVTFQGIQTILTGSGNDILNASFTTADVYLYAGLGDNTIVGGAGNDDLRGDLGDDSLDGGAGNDYFETRGGNDTVVGGDGNDQLNAFGGAVGNTVLYDAGAGNDTLFGSDQIYHADLGSGNDYAETGAGSDTINTGGGSDVIFTEEDADLIEIEDGFNGSQIYGGEGVSTGIDRDTLDAGALTAGVTIVHITSESGTLVSGTDGLSFEEIEEISLTTQGDSVDASTLSDGVSYDGGGGNDTLIGGAGADTLAGGDGDDLIDGGAGDDFLTTGLGQDTLMGGEGNDTLMNSDGDDSLDGGAGDDSIVATGGEDTLRGGTGADYMDGGNDADTFIIEDGFGNDTIIGGEGTTDPSDTDYDTIDLSMMTGPVTVTYTGPEAGTITDGTDTITFSEIEGFILTEQNDSFDASITGASVTVDGGGGDDSILASAGDDSVLGGDGADTIYGGSGDDYVSGGTGDDDVRGWNGNDTLVGGDGADTLHGQAGDDLLLGEADSDTFIIGDGFGNDTITGGEAGTDNDTIDLSTMTGPVTVTYTGDEAGTITDGTDTITFSEIERLILTEQADVVTATADTAGLDIDALGGDDSVRAGSGDDSIDGGTGNDSIWGGAGNNTLSGGVGDDFMTAGSGADSMSGGDGNDRLEAGGGNDTLSGGDGDDVILAGGGNDSLEGGAGNDTMHGEAGNDTFRGGDGNDAIDGNGGNDVIYGGAGDDRLAGAHGLANNGQTGNDTLFGEGGNDLFGLTNDMGNGQIIGGETDETTGDVLDASVATTGMTFVLTDLETGTISNGTATTSFSEIENYVGSSGNDTLDLSALAGAVTVTFTGDDAGTITDGTDTITFSEIERLILTDQDDVVDARADSVGVDIDAGAGNDQIQGGSGNDTIFGGNGNDTVFGGEGSDTISGGDGDDWLDGGTGNDSLTGGLGNDVFTYVEGDGLDTITDFNTGNTGALGDGDETNNDFIDLGRFYDGINEVRDDFEDDGILNQSNSTDNGGDVDYSNNDQFASGEGVAFQNANRESFTTDNTGVVCFTTGTAIRTPRGDVLIDDLRIGDLVTTMDNGPQPIRWIGTTSFGRKALVENANLRPILIKRGVLGVERDLLVSPQHGMLIGGDMHLARAKHLADTAPGIRTANGKRQVTYIHLMFDRHEIVFAEGTASESFYPGPTGIRMMDPAAREELFSLFPNIADCGSRQAVQSAYGLTARAFIHMRDIKRCLTTRQARPALRIVA